jgi:lactose/L-arabinose transport system ATP-binding protein
MTLADKIVVLKDGLIQQVGSPLSLYDDPENVFVAGFIGSPTINFVQGRVNGAKIIVPSLESLKLNAPKDIDSNQSELLIGLRPQHIQISGSGDLEVEFTEALGDVSYLYLKTPNGERIVVESRDDKLPKTAAKVGIKVDTSRALLFDPKTELRVR